MFRIVSIVLTFAVGSPRSGVDQVPNPSDSASHVRPADTTVDELIREGELQSSTFRQLVAELNQTDTFVYVERGICAFGHLPACLPAVVGGIGTARYLRIVLDRSKAPAPRQIALIGHELQHALEIARAPDVRDKDTAARLFARIGIPVHCPHAGVDCFETSAAAAATDAIARELAAATSHR